MSFTDLYESGEHSNNVGHFASLVNVASSDGALTQSEMALLERFARKLDIKENEYEAILESPEKYPINPPTSRARRLERLYDLFKMIYVDHDMDEEERKLLDHYAVGLGFTEEYAEVLIKKSIKIFGGKLDFEDYEYLLTT